MFLYPMNFLSEPKSTLLKSSHMTEYLVFPSVSVALGLYYNKCSISSYLYTSRIPFYVNWLYILYHVM